ncbi:MAG: hypothetical protein CO149_02470, partial [Nitrospirae bacterium CG_4_9_14_3_um_filter_51_5]
MDHTGKETVLAASFSSGKFSNFLGDCRTIPAIVGRPLFDWQENHAYTLEQKLLLTRSKRVRIEGNRQRDDSQDDTDEETPQLSVNELE